jgi:hypothetical protein
LGTSRAGLDKNAELLCVHGEHCLPEHGAQTLPPIIRGFWCGLLPVAYNANGHRSAAVDRPVALACQNRDDGIDRGLLYVAMTRAEDVLVILHSGSSSDVEELYRASGTEPP